jgi:two-component system sensor histidine kinase UhpB
MLHAHLFELCCVGAALFVASNLWFYVRVLRPIQRLSLQATALQAGQLDSFDQSCGGIPEIRELRRAMAGMVGHVRRAQDQSRAYTERLADLLENERKRIARELHDDTVQSVIAVTQSIDLARGWVHNEPQRAAQMLPVARAQAVEIVNGLRQLIGGLRPPALEELGLVAALRMHIEKIDQPAIELAVEGQPRRLDEAYELMLFRVTQEALTNVMRHSRAAQVTIKLTYTGDGVTLAVTDDGCGFQLPAFLGDFAFRQHYGLLGIQERAASLGGQLEVISAPGRGTTLIISLPVDRVNHADGLVRDPVCSAVITAQQAYGSLVYAAKTYYFCCPVCQGAFQQEPTRYLVGSSSSAVLQSDG